MQGLHIFKEKELKEKLSENFDGTIFQLFQAFAQFLFTTNQTELNYYHQKETVPVASRLVERLNT